MSLSQHLSHLSPRRLSFVVFLTILGGSMAVMSYLYLQAVDHQKRALQRHVSDLAVAAAAMIDIDAHEGLVRADQLGSADYHDVLAPLAKFHRRHRNIQYLWTTRVLKPGTQLFVLETSIDPEIRQQQMALGRSQDLLDFMAPDPETVDGAASIPVLSAGQPWVAPGVYADAHGSYIEARAPLFTTDERFIGYVGVDYALDSYQRQINEVRLAGLVSLVLAFGLSLVLARTTGHVARRSRDHLQEIQEQRDRADRANHAKSELLAIASHDLKNPLSAIAGMSGLMLQEKRALTLTPELEEDIDVLETIHSSAQHVSEIVRGILMNEGLESGGLHFEPKPTDLSAVCSRLLRFNAPAAKKKGITLATEISPDITINADAKLLHEAFDNYLSNAIKYSKPGTTVTVSLDRGTDDGAAVEFAVRDEGPGLSPEDQTKLFGKFQKLTARPTGGETSTGLGLSIVKTIAELHQGIVGCDSQLGHGARFWIRVPARSTAPAAS